MPATGRTYSIRTVHDFRSVPEDRRETCVKEFLAWLACCDFGAALAEDAANIIQPDTFEWTDDGKRSLGMTFATTDGEPVFSFEGTLRR